MPFLPGMLFTIFPCTPFKDPLAFKPFSMDSIAHALPCE
jgi:hypothetical protein